MYLVRMISQTLRQLCPVFYHLNQIYCVFDILYYEGKSVMLKPLIERKELLERILPSNDLFVFVRYFEGQGEALYELTKTQSLEGIVLKKADSFYKPGTRLHNWLKVINYQYENVFITGIRKNKISLLLSFQDGFPAGMLEFMRPGDKKRLYDEYRQHVSKETKDFIYLNPGFQGIVKYRNLIARGIYEYLPLKNGLSNLLLGDFSIHKHKKGLYCVAREPCGALIFIF